ncbi:MAG: ATP-binding domain-containing protein [Clostridia bacterium]|nr:ATP-binding domain-containing protein [Clostridia bacterium]
MQVAGKTTIALHRIAYLIYNYEKEFRPDEFMIIAPTKFFLNYISNILPDLGVNDVKQYTFEDFAYDVIGKKLKISDNNEKLVMIVNNEVDEDYKEKIDVILQESKLKSSIKFKNIMDNYLKHIENNYIPKVDFSFNEYKIMDYRDINELFINAYNMYNFSARINEIEKNLIYEFRKKSGEIIENVKAKRSKAVENLQGAERVEVFEKYEKIINQVEREYKKIVKNYLKQISNKTSIEYYKDFLENYLQNIGECASEFECNVDVISYLKKSTLKNLQNNEVAFEDLAPIMYLQYKILGIKEKCKVKHVVIDEAQDYGEFQFDVLKTILNSNSMTILGDLAQGVHFYRGIENWKRFMDVEFSDVSVTYTTLQKTYRTTKEIMNVANSVISKLPKFEREFIVLGEPVIDRKNSINIQEKCTSKELIDGINDRIDEYLKEQYKSIAIIGKDMAECKEIQKQLAKLRSDVKLIQGKDSEYNAGISVVPSYLAKGLEFDCVIIANASKEKYSNSSLDTKLLYVTITRAMSKLDIFYMGEISELLK